MMGKITCSVCGTKVEHDNEQGLKFKRKNYCYDCFSKSEKQDVVDQHMFYLKFQDLFGCKPTQVEWMQCRRLINDDSSSGEWDWLKIEKVMTYVYEIEKLEPTEEYGVIGILPYYEQKAEKFYDEYYEIVDMVEEVKDLQPKETSIHFKFKKTKPKKLELKSIDQLINWEEEEDGEI